MINFRKQFPYLIVLVASLLFMACENDVLDQETASLEPLSADALLSLQTTVENQLTNNAVSNTDLSFNYPLTFKENGTVVIVDNATSLLDFLSNVSNKNAVSLQFPLVTGNNKLTKETYYSSSDFEKDLSLFSNRSSQGSSDCCEQLEGKPVAITFLLRGGGCDADINSQGSNSECIGGITGNGPYPVQVTEHINGTGDLYFSGTLEVGDLFTASFDGHHLKTKFFVNINNGEEILEVDSNCSSPLVIEERFGSLELFSILSDRDEVCNNSGQGGDEGEDDTEGNIGDQEDNQDCCDSVEGSITAMTFTVLGGGCDGNTSGQGDDTLCTGGAIGDGPFHIKVKKFIDRDEEKYTYVDRTFEIGESFTVYDNGKKIPTTIFVVINDGEEVVEIHSSCSDPLIQGGRFGSVALEGLITDRGDICGNPNTNPSEEEEEDTTDPALENCCDDFNSAPARIIFEYTGGGCAEDNNAQGASSSCLNIDPILPGDAFIVVSENEDGSGTIYFSGLVNVSQIFQVGTSNALPASVFVNINNGQELLEISTSCADPLVLGDRFGSLTLMSIATIQGEVCSLIDP